MVVCRRFRVFVFLCFCVLCFFNPSVFNPTNQFLKRLQICPQYQSKELLKADKIAEEWKTAQQNDIAAAAAIFWQTFSAPFSGLSVMENVEKWAQFPLVSRHVNSCIVSWLDQAEQRDSKSSLAPRGVALSNIPIARYVGENASCRPATGRGSDLSHRS